MLHDPKIIWLECHLRLVELSLDTIEVGLLIAEFFQKQSWFFVSLIHSQMVDVEFPFKLGLEVKTQFANFLKAHVRGAAVHKGVARVMVFFVLHKNVKN